MEVGHTMDKTSRDPLTAGSIQKGYPKANHNVMHSIIVSYSTGGEYSLALRKAIRDGIHHLNMVSQSFILAKYPVVHRRSGSR